VAGQATVLARWAQKVGGRLAALPSIGTAANLWTIYGVRHYRRWLVTGLCVRRNHVVVINRS